MSIETLIWAGILLACVVFEAITVQLVSIWFALGALVSLLLTFFIPDGHLVQFFVFVGVSLVSLVLTRPLLKNHIKPKIQSTNSDRIIGGAAIVTEEINNTAGTGRAKVDGKDWTARSADENLIIPEGATVTVNRIEGVKIIVR